MIEVAAGLLIRENRFLISQRGPRDSDAGLWEFPGGKLENGETAQMAITRELAEEIGVVVEESRLLQISEYVYPDKQVRIHFLKIIAFSGEPVGKEEQIIEWVTPEESASLPFLAADNPLLACAKKQVEEGR